MVSAAVAEISTFAPVAKGRGVPLEVWPSAIRDVPERLAASVLDASIGDFIQEAGPSPQRAKILTRVSALSPACVVYTLLVAVYRIRCGDSRYLLRAFNRAG